MVEAARKSGKKLMVAQNHRSGSSSVALKKFIDAGELGEMYFCKVIATRRRGIPSWGVFTQKDKQGGGPMIDIGVHMIDLALWLLGHPQPTAASGQCYTKFGTREGLFGMWGPWDTKNYTVEDFAVGLIRFANGSTMYIESSFAANIEHDVLNVQILGTEGGCELSPLKVYKEERQTLLDISPVFLPNVNTYQAECRAFVESIIHNTEPPITGEQALMTTKIIDAIYESSDKGKEVPIL
jgi:predicted dehydrogenase